MDIQPCGSKEAIAFYIANYISKSEPTHIDVSVAQAILQIQREEIDVTHNLFKICTLIKREENFSLSICLQVCHLRKV